MATIRKRGDRWQARVRRKNCPTISRSFRLKADAERWASGIEVDSDRNALQADPRVLESVKLSDLVCRYRDTVAVKHRGYKIEAFILNAFLRHPIAQTKLSELAPSHFAAYRDERLKKVRPTTLNRELGLVQIACDLAKREWGIPIRNNPVKEISKPRRGAGRERRLCEGELSILLKALEVGRSPFMKSVVLFAVETGMRRGEILRAKWADVNRTESTLHIPVTKNGHPRTIPLSPGAMKVLEGISGEHRAGDLIFPVSGEAVKRVWQRLVRRAGIEDLHFHDLRHEAVSRFFEMGLSVPEVALISGHKDPRMLFRYTHLRAVDLVEKLKRA